MIKIEDLSFKYKEGNIGLDKINLEFKKGEVTMIIGSNGSGKSTLLSCMANLSKYQGKITLDNVDIKKIKNIEFRKRVGIVFQNPSNQIIMNTVYDDIKFTLNNLGVTDYDNKIKEALKIVNMEAFIDNNPYNLSLGQRERIALASCIALKKDFLLLDEVTSMIDYNGKQEIYKLIMKLKRENVGIIMTTNIIDELIFADKIIILSDKHTVEGFYRKEEIFNNLKLLKNFYIPFKFYVIEKIGYNNLDSLSDKELLEYVHK